MVSSLLSIDLVYDLEQGGVVHVREHVELPAIEPDPAAAVADIDADVVVNTLLEVATTPRTLHGRDLRLVLRGAFDIQPGALSLEPLGVLTGEILVFILAWLTGLPHNDLA